MEKYGSQRTKFCFVPSCTNTSVSTPEKVFVAVPHDNPRKKKWFTAARRNMPTSKSSLFCCEDHFNLEEDMQNYMRFKLMGGKVFFKQGVVPHIFNCQPDRKRASSSRERSLPAKLKRRRLVDEAISEYVKIPQNKPCTSTTASEPCVVSAAVSEPCTNTILQPVCSEEIPAITAIPIVSDTTKIPTQTRDVAMQVRSQFPSKYVMCNVTSKVKYIASSPIKSLVKDCSTSPTVLRRLPPKTSSSNSSFDLELSSSFVASASNSDKEQQFLCTICNRTFMSETFLKKHLKVHLSEKPFTCEICDFKSSREENLQIHLRTHTGEKPYGCKICNLKYSHLINLNNHMLSHTTTTSRSPSPYSRSPSYGSDDSDKRQSVSKGVNDKILKNLNNASMFFTDDLAKRIPATINPILQSVVPKTSIQIFTEFVGNQLEYLQSDDNILLETQEEIANIIWKARRKAFSKNVGT